MKQAIVRQAKGITVSCDPGANLALAKFASVGAGDACVIIPSTVVFWLAENLPVNQVPNLQAPPVGPRIDREDFNLDATPHVLSIDCVLSDPLSRVAFELNRKPHLTVLLDRSHVEMLRQLMEMCAKDLVKLDI